MKSLPFALCLLLCLFATPQRTVALPTTALEAPAETYTKAELRAQRKALRKELRKELRAARANQPMTEERLNRRANLALLFSILSIGLAIFTAGLILLLLMPFTRKVLTDYLYYPEIEKGYQKARVARGIAIVLTLLVSAYLLIFAIAITNF